MPQASQFLSIQIKEIGENDAMWRIVTQRNATHKKRTRVGQTYVSGPQIQLSLEITQHGVVQIPWNEIFKVAFHSFRLSRDIHTTFSHGDLLWTLRLLLMNLDPTYYNAYTCMVPSSSFEHNFGKVWVAVVISLVSVAGKAERAVLSFGLTFTLPVTFKE